MKINNALKQSGLTEKQAKIYLACLELGSAPVNLISEKSDTPRATCYDILESLRRMGIVSRFTKKKTRYYSVEDPKKLIHSAEQKTQELKNVLPHLEAIFYSEDKERPRVRFFQGEKGMEQILEEILQDKKDVLAFSAVDDLLRLFGDYWPRFVQERVKRKIISRVILLNTPKAHERKKLGLQQLRLVKMIPLEFKHQGTIVVFGNKVIFFSLTNDKTAIVIENKTIAQLHRSALEYIWEKAEDH